MTDKTPALKEIKLVPIGNSKGIRLPKILLEKYGWDESLLLEETERGLLLHSAGSGKLSWSATYRAIAAEDEDWSDWDATAADGVDGLD